MIYLFLIHTSLRVVGDCVAAKPSAQPAPLPCGEHNNGGGWLYAGRTFALTPTRVHENDRRVVYIFYMKGIFSHSLVFQKLYTSSI